MQFDQISQASCILDTKLCWKRSLIELASKLYLDANLTETLKSGLKSMK